MSSFRKFCILLQILCVSCGVVIVGRRDVGFLVNSSGSLSLDLLPIPTSTVELNVTASSGFLVGLSSRSSSSQSVVVRWERDQTKQLVYVSSPTCSVSGTLSFSATASRDPNFSAIMPSPPIPVNLFCAYPGRMEVSLAGGLSMSDLTLRDGESANLIFRAIRQRASTGSVGGVIPLNLPAGIQNNQNGSVLFPRFRSDQVSTELQVTIWPDPTAPRTSEISFGPIISDDPEWKGVIPSPGLVLNVVHPGNISASPASLGCLVGLRTTFALTLSAPAESAVTIGLTFPVGIALSSGLSSIVLPFGSTGPFFVDVTCAVATAGAITFLPASSQDAAFANASVNPGQLAIYSTQPARIDLRDNLGGNLSSASLQLLMQGTTTFRVVLTPASTRFLGVGGGQIKLTASPGFTVTPSPLRFGALIGPLEIIVTVNSTSSSGALGNLTFSPCISIDPQWQNLLPAVPIVGLIPVKPANLSIQGPAQIRMGQVSTISIVPSAPPNSAVRVTLAASSGFKLGAPVLQDTLSVDLPINSSSPTNISLTALTQSGGVIFIQNIETNDVQYRDAPRASFNVSSYAAGALSFRRSDDSKLPSLISTLIGRQYSFTLVVDRGNGLLNTTLPNGAIPFNAPPGVSIAVGQQQLKNEIPFEALPPGTPSRSTALTITAASVMQANISFGPARSDSVVWENISPQPSILSVDFVKPAIVSVSANTLDILTSSSASITLQASSAPSSSVLLNLTVPAGFRVRAGSGNASSDDSSSLFPAASVGVEFAAGVTSVTLLVQSDATVNSQAFLLLSSCVSEDIRFNGVLPSVNAIALSSAERGRLNVTASGIDQLPVPVIINTLFNVTLDFIGRSSSRGVLIAVCPGFTFVASSSVSSSIISFTGNSSINISLRAPTVAGFTATLSFLNVSSQDVEWNGVQANVPQIPLRVVDVPVIAPLNATLNVRADNSTTSFSLRVVPPPSSNVSVPFSAPLGCSMLGNNSGAIVVPANQQVPFEVNLTCGPAVLNITSPALVFDVARSSDRLFDGLAVTNLSLVAFSPAKVAVTDRNGTAFALLNSTAFPIGVVTFGISARNNNALNGSSSSLSGRAQNELPVSGSSGCSFVQSSELRVMNSSSAIITFTTSPNQTSQLVLFSLNCSEGAQTERNASLIFGEVNSTGLEWNRVTVDPPVVNFSLFALRPITVSGNGKLTLQTLASSVLAVSITSPATADIAIPLNLSGPFRLEGNVTTIVLPQTQTTVNVTVVATANGQGSLTFGVPSSADVHYSNSRVMPDSIALLAVAPGNITVVGESAGDRFVLSQIELQQTRNVTLNFTWSQFSNLTSSVSLSARGFDISPTSFDFVSGSLNWTTVPLTIASNVTGAKGLLQIAVNSSDPQWDKVMLEIPMATVSPAMFNVTPSQVTVLVGRTARIDLQSSFPPSANVSIRVTLPPSLQLIEEGSILRLPANSTNTSLTVRGTAPSSCNGTSMIVFDFQSADNAFVGSLLRVPVVVTQYGSARVVNSSSQPVDMISLERGQATSEVYSLEFFDTCNRSSIPATLPALIVTPSDPQLQTAVNTSCFNESACRLEFTVSSQITSWNGSRTLGLSLTSRDPIWIDVRVVPSPLPVISTFQGQGRVQLSGLSAAPLYSQQPIQATFVLSPAPVYPVTITLGSVANLRAVGGSAMLNVSKGETNITFNFTVQNGSGHFVWPYTVTSADNIYTSLDEFAFDIAPPTQAPTPASERPTMSPTHAPSLSPTLAPTTSAPSTSTPTTSAPSTIAPTTSSPTTSIPTTSSPTTAVPTTAAPTTLVPSTSPTLAPTQEGTAPSQGRQLHTSSPTAQAGRPTEHPTGQPTAQPTGQPTRHPTGQPTRRPTGQPTGQPTRLPTGQPTEPPTPQPSLQPTTLRPSANLGPTPGAPTASSPTPEREADVPRRAQINLNLTADATGNVSGMRPAAFLDQLSSDLENGLRATGLSLDSNQLTAVSIDRPGRRLLATEGILVDLDIVPGRSPEANSTQQVYQGFATALRTRDARFLDYSPLTKTINPNYFPSAVTLQNCSNRLAVSCQPTGPRGIQVPSPTSWDVKADSVVPGLKWWGVIAVLAAIVVCLIILICLCCCRKSNPDESRENPSRASRSPAEQKAQDSESLVQLTAPKKDDSAHKPAKPPISVVINSDAGKWRCSKCTYDNESGSTCNICGAPRARAISSVTHLAPLGCNIMQFFYIHTARHMHTSDTPQTHRRGIFRRKEEDAKEETEARQRSCEEGEQRCNC